MLALRGGADPSRSARSEMYAAMRIDQDILLSVVRHEQRSVGRHDDGKRPTLVQGSDEVSPEAGDCRTATAPAPIPQRIERCQVAPEPRTVVEVGIEHARIHDAGERPSAPADSVGGDPHFRSRVAHLAE